MKTKNVDINLKPGAHIHLIGICGTAMGSLAGILSQMGFRISGSDQNVYPPMSVQLADLGLRLQEGYRAENLNPRPDLVIVGNVVSASNPEVQAVLNQGIAYTSLPQAIGNFVIGSRSSIVVAGTHGKTTTTSMMAWMAQQCQINSGYLVGGLPENFGQSFQAPKGDWFIIEGDEYDTAFFDKVPKFVHYRPRYVILTSIEFDHADIYEDLSQVKEAFRKLIKLIPPQGHLVAYAEDPHIQELLPEARCPVTTYGLTKGDWRAVERMILSGRNHYCVEHKQKKVADVALKLFGEHNVLNSLAAYALGEILHWPQTQILQSLASFSGVRRRQQILGEPGGVLVIEDFAHHPTAVRLTLASLRERFPGRRLWAVFEPRSATSRRKTFQQDYIQALRAGDFVIVARAYDQTKIKEEDRFSSEQLVDDLKKCGVKASVGMSSDDIVQQIARGSYQGDVVLVMSNGGFDGIYKKLLRELGSKGVEPKDVGP